MPTDSVFGICGQRYRIYFSRFGKYLSELYIQILSDNDSDKVSDKLSDYRTTHFFTKGNFSLR